MNSAIPRITRRTANIAFLSPLLRKAIGQGRLGVIDWKGRRHEFGNSESAERCAIRIDDRHFPLKVLASPSLALGEAYMDGRVTIERGNVRSLLNLLTSNLKALQEHPLEKLRLKVGRLARRLQRNRKNRAKRNVSHHYNLSGQLYRLFLDEDRQYSCAYFPTGNETLEMAQAAKRRHLAAKLLLKPGQSVLDIGSGWGGLALELAREADVKVKGITLSTEQLDGARERAKATGLADRARFELQDYRDVEERFDRIVSVGMFEHVGTAHYDEFFAMIAGSLKRDGVAVLHSIGRRAPPGAMDPWITRHIFPGSYVPSLSEVLSAIERSGLWVTDIEILRLHYADTLRNWFERFQAHRSEARALYDERFCRMWEFYLAACEMMFRNGDLMVFQIQLAHDRDAVPLTRDYLTDFERQARQPSTCPTSAERRPQPQRRSRKVLEAV
jgi:cyclopropane-fatty-acyl-phospholipid synthase